MSFVGPKKKRYLEIKGSVSNMITEERIIGCSVLIYRNDTLQKEIKSDKNGKYEIKKMECDFQYKIFVMDSNYYSSNVILDLRNIPETIKSFEPLPLEIKLIEKFDISDTVCLKLIKTYENIPISRLKCDKRTNDLEWDLQMVTRNREKFDGIIKCIEKK